MIVLPLAPFLSDPGTHTNGSFFYFLKLLFVIERNFHHYPDDSLYVATISDNHTSKIKYFEQHKAHQPSVRLAIGIRTAAAGSIAV